MASGGARNRSGPQPDPSSARSDARGLSFEALPAEGYAGAVPDFPLPPRVVFWTLVLDGQKVRERDDAATDLVRERESELWAWAWRTPQAAAWAQPSESWRLHTIAMWVRTYVICEGSDATAADKSALHRFADQIGLTPAGLKENGWRVAHDEVAEAASKAPARASARERMKALPGGRG